MRRILLSGATGFVGSSILKEIIDDYQIDIITTGSSIERIKENLNKINLINYDDFFQQEKKYDVFIHCATNYLKSKKDVLDEMVCDNVLKPIKVIRHAQKFGLNKIINTGTCFEYSYSSVPISETSKRSAFNDYALSKIMFQSAIEAMNINVITLKLMTPYGPNDNEKLIQLLIRSLKNKKLLELSEGNQRISLVYISDVVGAYLQALEYILLNDNVKQEYLVTSNESISIREIVYLLEDISDKKSNVTFGEPNYNEISNMLGSNKKIKNDLGWKQKVSLREGLMNTIESFK